MTGRLSVELVILMACVIHDVTGNGRLLIPPQRSSLWRDRASWGNSNVYRNYNDHTLNCGGLWKRDLFDGRCGVCGDPWDIPEPRPNEARGIYARGIIGRTYTTDVKYIDAEVQVTSSMSGYFEFRLCPNNDVKHRVDQDCLDRYPMNILSKDLVVHYGRKFFIDLAPGKPGLIQLLLEIPEGLECTQCVLQWRWHGGVDFGICDNGRWGKGCGKQNEIFNCADIAILPPEVDEDYLLPVSTTTMDNNDLFTTPTALEHFPNDPKPGDKSDIRVGPLSPFIAMTTSKSAVTSKVMPDSLTTLPTGMSPPITSDPVLPGHLDTIHATPDRLQEIVTVPWTEFSVPGQIVTGMTTHPLPTDMTSHSLTTGKTSHPTINDLTSLPSTDAYSPSGLSKIFSTQAMNTPNTGVSTGITTTLGELLPGTVPAQTSVIDVNTGSTKSTVPISTEYYMTIPDDMFYDYTTETNYVSSTSGTDKNNAEVTIPIAPVTEAGDTSPRGDMHRTELTTTDTANDILMEGNESTSTLQTLIGVDTSTQESIPEYVTDLFDVTTGSNFSETTKRKIPSSSSEVQSTQSINVTNETPSLTITDDRVTATVAGSMSPVTSGQDSVSTSVPTTFIGSLETLSSDGPVTATSTIPFTLDGSTTNTEESFMTTLPIGPTTSNVLNTTLSTIFDTDTSTQMSDVSMSSLMTMFMDLTSTVQNENFTIYETTSTHVPEDGSRNTVNPGTSSVSGISLSSVVGEFASTIEATTPLTDYSPSTGTVNITETIPTFETTNTVLMDARTGIKHSDISDDIALAQTTTSALLGYTKFDETSQTVTSSTSANSSTTISSNSFTSGGTSTKGVNETVVKELSKTSEDTVTTEPQTIQLTASASIPTSPEVITASVPKEGFDVSITSTVVMDSTVKLSTRDHDDATSTISMTGGSATEEVPLVANTSNVSSSEPTTAIPASTMFPSESSNRTGNLTKQISNYTSSELTTNRLLDEQTNVSIGIITLASIRESNKSIISVTSQSLGQNTTSAMNEQNLTIILETTTAETATSENNDVLKMTSTGSDERRTQIVTGSTPLDGASNETSSLAPIVTWSSPSTTPTVTKGTDIENDIIFGPQATDAMIKIDFNIVGGLARQKMNYTIINGTMFAN